MSMPPGPRAADPDFERLEQVVVRLVERHRAALRENDRLRELIGERDQRLRVVDGQLLELNQRRQDVAKRIDDLVAQIVLLESQLAPAGE